jgi:hypothetical protein
MPFGDEPLLHDFADRSIRDSLQHPANLRDFLADVVPHLAPGFDCDRAVLLPRAFPLDDWRERESDLLFRIPYRGAGEEVWTLVCVLIEHQSDTDPRMPLRMLLYTVLHWEQEWKDWETQPAPRLPFRLTPPVVPIVLHTGPRPWGSARHLAELIGGPEAFHPFAPQYQPLFWDLAERSPQVLLQNVGEWLKALVVVRARDEAAPIYQALVGEALRQLEALGDRDSVRWHDLVRFVVSWAIFSRPQPEWTQLLATAQASQTNAARQVEVHTMTETIMEWKYRQGREDGEKSGEKKGALKAYREILRSGLEKQFGSLPGELAQRIESADDEERLKVCIGQLWTIKTLDELAL